MQPRTGLVFSNPLIFSGLETRKNESGLVKYMFLHTSISYISIHECLPIFVFLLI
jgi:hypothetical protein